MREVLALRVGGLVDAGFCFLEEQSVDVVVLAVVEAVEDGERQVEAELKHEEGDGLPVATDGD